MITSSFAPLVLFVYDRPHYLSRTLRGLRENEQISETELYVYCDGPKGNAPVESLHKIRECRELLKCVDWVKKLIVIERETNIGLGSSVIQGVTEVIKKHGKAIIVEDDVVTSKFFIKFMNEALAFYQLQKQVFSIGSWNYFATGKEIPETFFLPCPDTIAWATWEDRWSKFEEDSGKLIGIIDEKNLKEEFNLSGRYNFYEMLSKQNEGLISSWAIRWMATVFLNDGLTLYPKFSLADHIGVDAMATHSAGLDVSKKVVMAKKSIVLGRIPIEVNPGILQSMVNAYRNIGIEEPTHSWFRRFIRSLKNSILSHR